MNSQKVETHEGDTEQPDVNEKDSKLPDISVSD